MYSSKQFPVINLHDNITLREIEPLRDAINFLEYIRHPEVAQFLFKTELPQDHSSAVVELKYWHNLLSTYDGIAWSIRQNDQMIGMICCNDYNYLHKRVEISYDLNYNFWGYGIMQNAVKKVLTFLTGYCQVQRVQARVAKHNIRSSRLLEKVGFIQEGLMTNYAILHKQPTDYYIYGYVSDSI
jgi:ribosomal-protein-alanine N-acetyltransferase